ncbi:MAG: glycosyltransferase family 2 protein [Bryobacteraceae bacterium]
MLPALMFLAATPMLEQAMDSLFDPTFAGIHRLAWFDWALMLPYFLVLILLSVYGMHRYEMIRGFLKHRKKLTEGPAGHWYHLPKVTIQLPIYNEKFVVERLIEETVKMDYPKDLLQIQVLDDSTDETHPSPKVWLSDTTRLDIQSNTCIAATATGIKQARCRKG